MSHYFINDESLENKEFSFTYDYSNNHLVFQSNRGVFSKKRVDFGTNLLLNSLTDIPKGLILDVGCGIGVIGLSIAKRFPNNIIHLIDINTRALNLATINARINKISNVKIYESNLYANVTDKYTMIISNPPIRAGKKIVHKIIEEGFDRLSLSGCIYIVIQKKQGAPSLLSKMSEVFGNATIINKKNNYHVIVSKKET